MSIRAFLNSARGRACAIRSLRGDTSSVLLGIATGGQLWLVRFEDVIAMSISLAESKRVLLESRHILIEREVGPFAELAFKGEIAKPVALHADLEKAHRAIAGTWTSLEESFKVRSTLPKLFESGRGSARGPQRLISAYAKLLRRYGCEVKAKPVQGGRYLATRRWTAARPDYAALIIGGGYLVGRPGSAERVRQ